LEFYTNQTIIGDFKNYINYLLTHKNKYTGISMAEDPTVAIIETGNELSGPDFGDMYIPISWTQVIAHYVKSLGPHKLIMDGTYGINTTHFAVNTVDLFSDHFYPLNISRLEQGSAQVKSANRVYVAGEYDWTGLHGGDNLTNFFSAIEADQKQSEPVISGDLFWR
jgi:mannan endo-1,4-beta-mannosidase